MGGLDAAPEVEVDRTLVRLSIGVSGDRIRLSDTALDFQDMNVCLLDVRQAIRWAEKRGLQSMREGGRNLKNNCISPAAIGKAQNIEEKNLREWAHI